MAIFRGDGGAGDGGVLPAVRHRAAADDCLPHPVGRAPINAVFTSTGA